MASSQSNDLTAYQEVFVAELRVRRENAGLSRNKLAQALGCSPQWISKIETFEKPPSEGLAEDLDTFFAASGLFWRLWGMHIEARKNGLIPRGFRPLIGAEKEAVRINIYEPLLIPGLLQTEEYARLVLSVGLQSDKLEELVSIRMERQVLLSREDPPWIFLLIREAVIRDLRPEVRVGQCKRLLGLMDNPKFSVQVLPADALVFHPTGYQVLSFRRQQDIAYMEGTAGNAQMLTDSDVVRQLAVLFDVVRSEAFSAKDSANVIQSIMEAP